MNRIRKVFLAAALMAAIVALGAMNPAPIQAAADSAACTLFGGCVEDCNGDPGCKVHEKCEGGSCKATTDMITCRPEIG